MVGVAFICCTFVAKIKCKNLHDLEKNVQKATCTSYIIRKLG